MILSGRLLFSFALALALPSMAKASEFNTPAKPLHRVQFITSGAVALRGYLDAIADAKRSIEFESYLYSTRGISGRLLLDGLMNKAKSGLKVRILLDAASISDGDWSPELVSYLKRVGIAVRFFGLGRRLPPRDHRKLLIVDRDSNPVVFAGGRNISDENFQLIREIRLDYTLRIDGPVALEVGRSFDDFWDSKFVSEIEISSHVVAHLEEKQWMIPRSSDQLQRMEISNIPTFEVDDIDFISDAPAPGTRTFLPRLLERLQSVRSSVVAESPYFQFGTSLKNAFQSLASRGKTVEFIDSNSEMPFQRWLAYLVYGGRFTPNQIRGAVLSSHPADFKSEIRPLLFPENESDRIVRFSHSKSVIFDDVDTLISSYNFDSISEYNIEAGFYFNNAPKLAQHLRGLQKNRGYSQVVIH